MGKCCDCEFIAKYKHIKYATCLKFPRDEINNLSDTEMIGEPYNFCRDINYYGQCKYFKGEKNE